MAMQDILQRERKYKNPYLRKWYHSSKGDDTYNQVLATKKKLQIAKKRKGLYVAYKGKEYDVNEFLKKHPKFNIKGRKK